MPDQMVWTAPDGQVIDLTDQERHVVDPNGTRGLRSPAYTVASATFAGVDGAMVQNIRADPRDIAVGLKMFADDEADLRARVRSLVRSLRPRAGIGRLTVTSAQGESRHLDCYCTGGYEGDETPDTMRPGRWWRTVLRFLAPDPWWYGDQQTIDFGLAAPTNFFPFFPLALSASSVQGSFTVDLSGADSASYPLWTVTGPGDTLLLTNTTTGQQLEVTLNLGDGQSAIIDTRPGRQSIRAATIPTTVTEQRRNLIPNPTVGTNTTGWSHAAGGGTAALTRVATGGPTGGPFARVTWSAAATSAGGAVRIDGRPVSTLPIPVSSGASYAGRLTVRASLAQQMRLRLAWHDAAGQALSSTTWATSPTVAVTANEWTTLTVAGVAPGDGYVMLIVDDASTGIRWPVGATLDGALGVIEQSTAVGGYFDGDTADSPTASYAWTGTAHASASTQSLVAHGQPIIGDNLMGGLAADPALWPLTEGVNEVSALLTNAGGAARITGVYMPRFAGI